MGSSLKSSLNLLWSEKRCGQDDMPATAHKVNIESSESPDHVLSFSVQLQSAIKTIYVCGKC